MQCADYGVYAAAVKASFPMSVMLGEVWTGIVVEWKLTAVSEYYTLHKQLITFIDILAQGSNSLERLVKYGRALGAPT